MVLPPQPIKPGAGLKSPIGGPSGPGGSPMVSPGTGAGMQARAQQDVEKVINQLLQIGASFPKGSPQFNGIVGAIGKLNAVFKGAPAPEPPKQPLPVPPTAPGAGLGGAPGGMPPPMGGAPMGGGGPSLGGPGGLAPGGE
jgi:hypothetical protein